MHRSSQRPFLPAVSSLAAGALPPGPQRVAAAVPAPVLTTGWEFRRGSAAGIWAFWRPEDNWAPVSQSRTTPAGPSCYRTRLQLSNPIVNGRTILHFQATGQSATLWIGPILIGTRAQTPGTQTPADFIFDITDALTRLAPSEARHGIPIAVLCDNSAGASDSIPFRATLAYLPALALDTLAIQSAFTPDGSAHIAVKAALYNPNDRSSFSTISIELLDPSGDILASVTETVEIWRGLRQLATLTLADPHSSEPYRCRVTLTTPDGQTHLEEPFTLRQPKRVLRFQVPHDHAAQSGALSWA